MTIIQQLVNITLSGGGHFGFRRYWGLQAEHFVDHLKTVFCVSQSNSMPNLVLLGGR